MFSHKDNKINTVIFLLFYKFNKKTAPFILNELDFDLSNQQTNDSYHLERPHFFPQASGDAGNMM